MVTESGPRLQKGHHLSVHLCPPLSTFVHLFDHAGRTVTEVMARVIDKGVDIAKRR